MNELVLTFLIHSNTLQFLGIEIVLRFLWRFFLLFVIE